MATVVTEWVAKFIDEISGPVNSVGEAADGAADAVENIGKAAEKTTDPLNKMLKSFGKYALSFITIKKAFGFLKEGEAGFLALRESEIQLGQVMSNTMNAAEDEIKTIVALADAQERAGVVSKTTQLAGAQELATYLEKRESLEKLLPVMTDMLAQQYGFSASQEQAINIASMLGKVMDGQVGALSRYGYKFDEAQEKILKTGTEAQRAAVLFDVVSSSVGGMNEALASMPEGQNKKAAMELSGVKDSAGAVVVYIKNALLPVYYQFIEIVRQCVAWLDENKEAFIAFAETVANVAVPVLSSLFSIIQNIIGGFVWLFSELANGNPIVGALAAIVGVLTAAYVLNYAWGQRLIVLQTIRDVWAKREIITSAAVAAWRGILAIKDLILTGTTAGLTVATMGLNAAFYANPLVWIIALVAGLIAGVVLAWQKFEGFRKVVFGCWEVIKGFGNLLKEFVIDRIKGLLSGLGAIGQAIAKLFKGDFEGAWESAKQGVVDISGVNAAKNAIENFKGLADDWDKGVQKGAESWAKSQEEKQNEETAGFGPLQSFQMSAGGTGANPTAGAGGKADKNAGDGVKLGGAGGTGGGKTINMTVNNYISGFKGTKEMAEAVATAINNRLSDGLAAL